jgi:phage shock protein A
MSLLRRLRAIGPWRKPAAAPEPETVSPAAVDLEYAKLLADLEAVRRLIADASASRRKLEAQAEQVGRDHLAAKERARIALGQNQENLARVAVKETLDAERRLADRRKAIDALVARERELHSAAEKLEAGIHDYGARLDAARDRDEAVTSR